MTINAVIFDVGGVLYRFLSDGPYRRWETRLGLSTGQLYRIIFDNPVSDLAMIGCATMDEAWTEAGKLLALKDGDLEALKNDIYLGGYWDTELLSFISSLRPRYKTGVISDAWLGTRDAIHRWVNSDVFDMIMFSAEENIRKPNPDIFKRALSRLQVSPQEAIFLDDLPHNVESAHTLGMHAIHFDATFEIRDELGRLLQA
ncbi:MAG: HAD family phosphatase [Chloroflexota bacterium]|nr:HAD family phosphatase [Chloroflexota bacterium]